MTFFKERFRLVIFDMDGVVIDSEPIHMSILNSVCAQWGEPLTSEEYDSLIGKSDKETWDFISERYHISKNNNHIGRLYSAKVTDFYRSGAVLPVVKNVPELLAKLKNENIFCAIGSSSSNYNLELKIERTGLRGYFNVIIGGEDVRQAKPAPDIFLLAAQRMKIHPRDCAVIEDSTVGVLAAKKANMFCIGYRNASGAHQNLADADLVIRDISELWID